MHKNKDTSTAKEYKATNHNPCAHIPLRRS